MPYSYGDSFEETYVVCIVDKEVCIFSWQNGRLLFLDYYEMCDGDLGIINSC